MQSVFPAQADIPDGPPTGAVTPLPPSRHSASPTRRETILSLVEILLQKDGDDEPGNSKISEDDKEVPSVDEHLQVLGAESFNKFQRRVNQLDNELRSFANASRQLGSSVAILSSAYHLRERLAQILILYRENAADLFPRKITHLPKDAPPESGRRRKRGRPVKIKTPVHVVNARPAVDQNLDLEFFPEQLEALATDVTTFLNSLNEFPEFTDEGVNASIRAFEGDLKYWASCLRDFSGHFRYPSVQRYMHDLSTEMGDHIDSITSSLSTFIEVGVPTIRFAQKHGANNLLNLSTVATFFSAVTATTLQFSFELDHTPAANAVNCLWFSSMVFSIAAAVNSLLGVTWKQAMYRSPGHRVPWWVLIWIKRSPLVFLVMSVACFSIGLCCFAYATNQAGVTSTLTTVFTAFTSFGLTAVSAWFASERAIFYRHRGQKWLNDVLNEYWALVLGMPGMKRLRKTIAFTNHRLNRLASILHRVLLRLTGLTDARSTTSEYTEDLEANTLPTAYQSNPALSPNLVGTPTLSGRRPADLASEPPRSPALPPPSSPALANEKEVTSPTSPVSPGRQLWKNALRTVQMHSAVSSTPPQTLVVGVGNPREPRRRRTVSSNGTAQIAPMDRFRSVGEEVYKGVVARTRVAALQPKLAALEPTQDLSAHTGLVRHLQFSPDGSWDRTSMVFRVGDPFASHRVLAHPQGFVSQVAWSPDGKYLLTKLTRHIRIWTAEEGVCVKTIDRKTSVESITWFPDGQAFISVEGSDVIKLNLKGSIDDSYDFGRMKLHDVAVTPDSQRLIGVGPLLESPSGLQPSKSRAEKRLVVYNMETKQCENQTPVLNDVRDITVVRGRGGILALVSYENKAPPQLWKLETIKDRETNAMTSRLTLKHTYMPKMQVDFAGNSYFGGKNNELVLCAGKAGDIHIWDQESGMLLHHIKAQAHGGDLTCIAWNHAFGDPFMFAAGSHDGNVRVWTQRSDDGDSEYLSSDARHIPRTNSPLPVHDLESRPSTQQDPDSQYEEPVLQLPTFSSRKYSPRSRSLTASNTAAAPPTIEPDEPPRPMTLTKRILAYAAAQRAAEAQAAESGQAPDAPS